MYFFIALLPLLAVFSFLFFLKQSTLRAGTFSFLFTIIITLLVPNFHLAADQIILSSIKGVLISFIAAYILFFGIFLFHLMNNIGAIQSIAMSISNATDDRILQVLTLIVGLSPLLESTSGFGIAFMMVTPIFMALGFGPMKSVLLGLISLLAVPWGALATGTVIGAELISVPLQAFGIGSALLSIPVFIYFIVVAVYIAGGKMAIKTKWKEILLFSFSFSISITFFNALVSVELAGVLSSFITTGLGFILMKGTLKKSTDTSNNGTALPLIKAISPYIILTAFIFITRLWTPVKDFFMSFGVIRLPSLSFTMALFYSPGFWLLITSIITVVLFKISKQIVIESMKKTIVQWVPFMISTTAFIGISEMMSEAGMTSILANVTGAAFGTAFFFVSSFIGGIGGFLTSSSTGSNAMFIKLQTETAIRVGIPPEIISYGQNVGASHATMASPARVALGVSICGIPSDEHLLLRKIILIVAGALLIVAFTMLGWIIIS